MLPSAALIDPCGDSLSPKGEATSCEALSEALRVRCVVMPQASCGGAPVGCHMHALEVVREVYFPHHDPWEPWWCAWERGTAVFESGMKRMCESRHKFAMRFPWTHNPGHGDAALPPGRDRTTHRLPLAAELSASPACTNDNTPPCMASDIAGAYWCPSGTGGCYLS
jgi:hypothetical protein